VVALQELARTSGRHGLCWKRISLTSATVAAIVSGPVPSPSSAVVMVVTLWSISKKVSAPFVVIALLLVTVVQFPLERLSPIFPLGISCHRYKKTAWLITGWFVEVAPNSVSSKRSVSVLRQAVFPVPNCILSVATVAVPA